MGGVGDGGRLGGGGRWWEVVRGCGRWWDIILICA